MNTYPKLIYIILCFAFYSQATAQVYPPQLSCIKIDTLVWDLPQPNTCGSFNAYEIYTSSNINGPYTLLTSITDPTQTKYEDPNPSAELRYYYMQGNFNCAGEVILQSDTLDNLLPESFTIERVSVIDNVKVDLTWNPSLSPEVNAYIIYRVTTFGTMPIDTVYNRTNYVDQFGSPGLGPETYYVVGLDDCGNTSAFDQPHSTIHLRSGASICERSVSLNWNLYENWTNGIEAQEIWLSVNNAPATNVATLGATDTTYVMENATDGDFYCFYINAIEKGTGIVAKSTETCRTIDVVTPADDVMLVNLTVNQDNQVTLEWYWNTNADVLTYSIHRQRIDDDVILTFDFPAINPLSAINTYTDTTANPAQGAIGYQLFAEDSCDNPTFTEQAATVFAQVTANEDRTNLIQWSPYNLPSATVINYEIYNINSSSPIAVVSNSQFSHIDPVDASNIYEAEKCYYVIATAMIELPDGTIRTVKSRSNTVCVKQFSTIYAPNAFVPYGKNPVFKPVVLFGDAVSDYQMVIYDRWGNRLFESKEIEIGWDGRKEGRDMPEGAYTFVIRLSQPNGEILENKGVLMLVR